MGLDIYLSKYENFEETRRKEQDYNQYSEEYGALSNEPLYSPDTGTDTCVPNLPTDRLDG